MARKPTLHSSLAYERIKHAVEREMFGLDNPGFCTLCGAEQDGCEPDARGYECEQCGKRSVYGAAELLLQYDLA